MYVQGMCITFALCTVFYVYIWNFVRNKLMIIIIIYAVLFPL